MSKLNDIFDLESPELLASELIKASLFYWILILSTKKFPTKAALNIKALSYSISAYFSNFRAITLGYTLQLLAISFKILGHSVLPILHTLRPFKQVVCLAL